MVSRNLSRRSGSGDSLEIAATSPDPRDLRGVDDDAEGAPRSDSATDTHVCHPHRCGAESADDPRWEHHACEGGMSEVRPWPPNDGA